MDVASDDLSKGPVATVLAIVIAVAIAAAQWLLHREIKRRDLDIEKLQKKDDDQEVRIRMMEIDRVTRADIGAILITIEANRVRSEERHLEVLDRIGVNYERRPDL